MSKPVQSVVDNYTSILQRVLGCEAEARSLKLQQEHIEIEIKRVNKEYEELVIQKQALEETYPELASIEWEMIRRLF